MEEWLKEVIAEELGLVPCVFGGYVTCECCDGNCEQMEDFLLSVEIDKANKISKELALFDITKNEKENATEIDYTFYFNNTDDDLPI